MKSVLITGCSSGIGLCLAQGLKHKGYRVFATVRDIKDVEQLKQQGFDAFVLDLSSSKSINTAIKAIFEETEDLYFLILNFAYGLVGAF
jgi:NADP-dependent 3-hydroxy acid dehydrogenase YdfG